jgi:hypothetical protein
MYSDRRYKLFLWLELITKYLKTDYFKKIMLTETDFKIEKIMPPAFAGIIIDFSAGAKEITSTIIDLTMKGCLTTAGDRLFLSNIKKCRYNFERCFVSALFDSKKELSFKEVSLAYKEKFENLIKIIVEGFKEEGFLAGNIEQNMANAVKKTIKENFGSKERMMVPKQNKDIITLPVWAFPVFTIVVGILFFVSLTIFIAGLVLSNPVIQVFGFTFLIFTLPPLAIILFIKAFQLSIVKNLDKDWLLSEKGKQQKSKVIGLEKYMKKYPLIEDRLANELVSYSIVFGIGKNWLRKLGEKNRFYSLGYELIASQSLITMNAMDMDKYWRELGK